MEIHDFQRLVEVFHLHRVRAEFAHLPELFFVAHQGRESKVLWQFLVESLALLRVVAVDFSDADKCEIQISYAIGVAKPVSVLCETFGTSKIDEQELIEKINDTFDLTPRGIINYLDLQRPIYKKTTNYGHFGKDELPWERIISF